MSGPARPYRLLDGRQGVTIRALLQVADAHFLYEPEINWNSLEADRVYGLRPLEIFLRPAGAVKAGSMLATYSEHAGESLSLLLQHGHSPSSLFHRYKPGDLGRSAAALLLITALQEGLALDVPCLAEAMTLLRKMHVGQCAEVKIPLNDWPSWLPPAPPPEFQPAAGTEL